mmetsp:Transcript_1222/g.4770  ORF Transcript_1222/g.4770 Transcript_1222/m.4770 type:complete len:245 (+) Transcript_1222:5013-5747(+)
MSMRQAKGPSRAISAASWALRRIRLSSRSWASAEGRKAELESAIWVPGVERDGVDSSAGGPRSAEPAPKDPDAALAMPVAARLAVMMDSLNVSGRLARRAWRLPPRARGWRCCCCRSIVRRVSYSTASTRFLRASDLADARCSSIVERTAAVSLARAAPAASSSAASNTDMVPAPSPSSSPSSSADTPPRASAARKAPASPFWSARRACGPRPASTLCFRSSRSWRCVLAMRTQLSPAHSRAAS